GDWPIRPLLQYATSPFGPGLPDARGVRGGQCQRWAAVAECEKIMKLRETKWENQTEPKPGMRCSVRARPLRGLAGRSSRPTWANRTKQSDCPQNSAHLMPATVVGARMALRPPCQEARS